MHTIKDLLSRCKLNDETGCLEWQGAVDTSGYGAVKFNGKKQNTHRVMWMLINGDIPKGLLICHKCDNRLCINPDHLFLGTYHDNRIDCINKKRNNTFKTAEKLRRPLVHGSLNAYKGKGCRCDICRKSVADHQREYIHNKHIKLNPK